MIKNSPSPTVSNTHTHLHIQICFVIWDFLEIHMIAKVTDMLFFWSCPFVHISSCFH